MNTAGSFPVNGHCPFIYCSFSSWKRGLGTCGRRGNSTSPQVFGIGSSSVRLFDCTLQPLICAVRNDPTTFSSPGAPHLLALGLGPTRRAPTLRLWELHRRGHGEEPHTVLRSMEEGAALELAVGAHGMVGLRAREEERGLAAKLRRS